MLLADPLADPFPLIQADCDSECDGEDEREIEGDEERV